MQVQLNTDHHLVGSEDLARRLDDEVQSALARFRERITRVEMHLNDLNGAKSGADKRCQIEARVAGRPPLSVEHTADTVRLAIDGALDKLVRTLDRTFGKLEADRHRKVDVPDGEAP